MTVNRVGDMFLSIGFFAILWVFGNVDYATVFRIAPYINETAITIIGLLLLIGAMAKSAQFGLHTWLPDAMEGKLLKYIWNLVRLFSSSIQSKKSHNNISAPSDILKPSESNKPSNSSPSEFDRMLTGSMLGDGSITPPNRSRDKKQGKVGPSTGNCRYAMTMDRYSLAYLTTLYNMFAHLCSAAIIPYPNINLPQHAGKTITQYSFYTLSSPFFTRLHQLWYRYDRVLNCYIKIVPLCIGDMFTVVSLAHWIMQDGYFDNNGRTQTILLCTECYTKDECILLQGVLRNMGIKSTLKRRNKDKDTYRIRISKLSMPLVRQLVRPYMHPDFIYKLGEK